MKTTFPTLILIAVFIVFACKKKSNEPEPEPAPTTTGTTTSPTGTFTWTENGGPVQTADSAVFYTTYKTLYAYKGGFAKYFEINFPSTAAGSYPIDISTAFTQIANTVITYAATGGTLNVSTNSGTQTSGTFTTTASSGTLTAVSGGYTNVKVK